MTGGAIFHVEQPDGTVVAHSQSHVGWALVSKSFAESHKNAEPSLREHIHRTQTFAHYDVPIANSHLRPVA